jgi:NAD(P)-dependent dehydrogenase (short-subunit alcohol dehydrogenase family)
MSDLFSIAGRRALVVGGSHGIGRMIAAGYVAAGARVHVCSRDEAEAQAVAKELSGDGVCLALRGDISTEAGCRQIAERLAAREDALDILVNSAGDTWMADLEDFGEAGWERVLAVNLKGPFHLVRFLVPLLRSAAETERPARVINIGSISATRVPDMDNFSYTTSKSALHTLTRHLARRLAPAVTVNAIAPGPFPSRMMAPLLSKHGERMAAAAPMRRIGRPDDMAGAAIFLASPAAAWITGTVLTVDGGISTT